MLVTIVTPALAAYETAFKIAATQVRDNFDDFLFEWDNKTYLLHHGTGCGTIKDGDELTLVVRGEMDGYSEELRRGNYYKCPVDMVEPITGAVTVATSSTGDRTTVVDDENARRFRIYYSENCHALKGMRGYKAYVRQYGYGDLQAGDTIFVPDSVISCALTSVVPLFDVGTDSLSYGGDQRAPSSPFELKAVPRTDSVDLYWKAATDDLGIAYYIISHSLYPVSDELRNDFDAMPNHIYTPTNATSYKMTGLEMDETYYFRVIAVDTAGNISAYWSNQASATTRSSILEPDLTPEVLRLYYPMITDRYFLFRWNDLPGGRYTVILEVDDVRTVAIPDWPGTYVKVLKTAERKGKKLKLIIRGINLKGQQFTDSWDFSF